MADQKWNYLSDNGFWTGSPAKIPAPDPGAPCLDPAIPGTCLSGSFWVHADTDVGNTQPVAGPDRVVVGLHGAELANHYFGLAPDPGYAFTISPGAPRFIFVWQTLPDPYRTHAQPQPEVLVSLEQKAGIYALQDTGGGLDVSAAISSALQAKMHDSSVIFASAVEPNARVGQLRGTILGPALSTDGTSLVDSVEVSDALGMHLGAEGVIVHSDPPLAPTPRTGFLSFFSRAAGGTFLVGGVDASTHAPLREIWFQRFGRPGGQLQLEPTWSGFGATRCFGSAAGAAVTRIPGSVRVHVPPPRSFAAIAWHCASRCRVAAPRRLGRCRKRHFAAGDRTR